MCSCRRRQGTGTGVQLAGNKLVASLIWEAVIPRPRRMLVTLVKESAAFIPFGQSASRALGREGRIEPTHDIGPSFAGRSWASNGNGQGCCPKERDPFS